MSKRLILVLALALVAGLTCAAYAEVQNVKVSGDLTVLGISRSPYLGNAYYSGTTLTNSKVENAMASIVRIRVDADLTDNVVATIRLLNERYWGREQDNVGSSGKGTNSDIDVDLAYVTMKEFLYSPLTLTIGRQELHFGNDMIIGDPDTNNMVTTASPFNGAGTGLRDPDLSARKSFDAIRATLNYDFMNNPLVVDVIMAQVKNTTLGTKDDENLYGVNANYQLNKKTTLEGYWFERSRGKVNTSGVTTNKSDRTDVYGARVVNQSVKNLTAQIEAAMQFGNVNTTTTNTQRRRAWATEAALTYDLKDVKKIGKYKPNATALFAFFSGNKGDSGRKTNSAWDPMYENQKFGDLANALFNQSNIMLTGGIISMKPVDDVTLKGEYYAYWWDKVFNDNTGAAQATSVLTGETLFMNNGKFAGQEMDATVTYDYTEDVQFALMGGLLMPGDSFNAQNRNTATEVIGSMKVTF